jgi:1-deoxy-D-xylulose-5-phosphate reductoisomerase
LWGGAGLLPTLEAIDAGKDIALANKETLVMAGGLVMEQARQRGVKLLPVDSEHSAIFQCMEGHRKQEIKRIILTASGGPFRNLSIEKMRHVTVKDALQHPNWKMGKKITIDSASMMNKGLEVIEARWLFAMDLEKIHVHIHPQSIVHSMVEYIDGSVIAQLGIPDMKGPISYAFSYPERFKSEDESIDFIQAGNLEFIRPDIERFPCLKLAYEAAGKGGTMPCVLNASNEIAVEAFLAGRIGFMDIPVVIEKAMAAHDVGSASSIEMILEADRWAREKAIKIIRGFNKRS